MKNKTTTVLIIIICLLLTLRDYIQAVSKMLSPILSITAYGLIFVAFFYDVYFLRNQKIERTTLKYTLVLLLCCILHFEAYTLLLLYMFVYVIRDYDYKKIIDYCFYPRLVFSIVLVIAFYLGLTPDTTMDLSYKGVENAHNFGITGNPNNASFVFFSLEVLMFLRGCLRKSKLEFFLPIAIAFWNHSMTGSRTFLGVIFALYVIYIFIHLHILFKLSYLSPFFAIAITFAIAIWCRDNLILNGLLSGRPWRWHDWLKEMNIIQLWFGPGIESTEKITIDSSVLEIVIYGGLLLLILLCKDYIRLGYRKKDKTELAQWSLLHVLVFAGLMESLMFSQIRDIVILNYVFLYNILREKKKKTSYMLHYQGL